MHARSRACRGDRFRHACFAAVSITERCPMQPGQGWGLHGGWLADGAVRSRVGMCAAASRISNCGGLARVDTLTLGAGHARGLETAAEPHAEPSELHRRVCLCVAACGGMCGGPRPPAGHRSGRKIVRFTANAESVARQKAMEQWAWRLVSASPRQRQSVRKSGVQEG